MTPPHNGSRKAPGRAADEGPGGPPDTAPATAQAGTPGATPLAEPGGERRHDHRPAAEHEPSRKDELLDALIATAGEHGIGGRSLRDLAASVGTSHRMLLHHFGSREGLMVAIVAEVERRQRANLRHLPADPAGAIAAAWADLRRPQLRPFERLFFECYARGAQGEAPFDRMLPAAVDDWLREAGDDPRTRLVLATLRGLLLDLVGTGDEEGVDAAAALFTTMWLT